MERTQIYKALQGVRGQKPVDLDSPGDAAGPFQPAARGLPGDSGGRHQPGAGHSGARARPGRPRAAVSRRSPPEQRPRLAIHPYPNQYTAPFRLARRHRGDQSRPIRPEDEPLIIALHAAHSEHTIRMRFFSMVKTLSRDSLIRLCHLDYDREMAPGGRAA